MRAGKACATVLPLAQHLLRVATSYHFRTYCRYLLPPTLSGSSLSLFPTLEVHTICVSSSPLLLLGILQNG
ncbi:hypothetical protein F5B17DRAFT_51783 [Nemania serpens]|nr:hypothetical protein F5B17DRAFT_51783 [Nemania serpens]